MIINNMQVKEKVPFKFPEVLIIKESTEQIMAGYLSHLKRGNAKVAQIGVVAAATALPLSSESLVQMDKTVEAANSAKAGFDSKAVPTTDVIAQLVAATKQDSGAPLEPDAIMALTLLQAENPAEFHRVRTALKRANKDVPLSLVDDAIRAQQRNEQAAPTHHIYANELLKALTVSAWTPVAHEGVLFVVDPLTSIWVKVPPEALERKVAELHDGGENCVRRSDYTAIGTHAMILASDDKYFQAAPIGLACPGGFYSVQDGAVRCEQLTPDHRQRVLVDVTPVAMATPLFDTFLHETFEANRAGEEAQQVDLLQEIAGATMLGIMHRFQKAAMWFDPFGRAGKGTTDQIIRALVPRAFVTAVTPFNWGSEYYLASLAGARLNVVGELSDSTPIPAAAFKTVTGGDLLTGRNPAGRPFSFKNEAAHIFMTNHLINTRDQSEAFYIRWLLLDFPNSRTRKGLSQDVDLAKRIIAQELPGIAYWALQGAIRLLQNGKFSPSMAHDRLMSQWRKKANSLEEYIDECCDIGSSEYTFLKSKLYESYVLWCKDSGRKPYSKSNVKELLEHNAKLGITLARINNGYETFKGVRLKLVSQAQAEHDELEY